jgi:hypothetical protein
MFKEVCPLQCQDYTKCYVDRIIGQLGLPANTAQVSSRINIVRTRLPLSMLISQHTLICHLAWLLHY